MHVIKFKHIYGSSLVISTIECALKVIWTLTQISSLVPCLSLLTILLELLKVSSNHMKVQFIKKNKKKIAHTNEKEIKHTIHNKHMTQDTRNTKRYK